LRDEIYSWPSVNPCRVDQETVSEDYADAGFFDQELVNTRGLDALEYLLFDTGTDNACAPTIDINTDGSWTALINSGNLLARRTSYAALAAEDVSKHAIQLRDAWEPTGGDFAGQLARAGQSGSPFGTAQDAVNEVFAGLFYLELDVKDEKMAPPAGISPDCSGEVCPNLSESIYADASKEHLLRNLVAGQQIFHGGSGTSGVGFDDFLRALDASGLATQMTADFAAAIAGTEAIPGTFITALNTDPDSVRAAYEAVKKITDELKSQFATVLNLKIPQEGAGDND
jgi:predicted lipoprotein